MKAELFHFNLPPSQSIRSLHVALVSSLAFHFFFLGILSSSINSKSKSISSQQMPPLQISLMEQIHQRQVKLTQGSGTFQTYGTSPKPQDLQNRSALPSGAESIRSINSDESTEFNHYVGHIRQLVEQHKKYPAFALKRGQQGRVVILLKLDQDGRPLEVKVLESSEYSDLDEASLNLIHQIKLFSPIPTQLKMRTLTLKIPIDYKLQ